MAKYLAFAAVEIALLVTPMIWPTIPFEIGMFIYGVAVAIAVLAGIFWWKDSDHQPAKRRLSKARKKALASALIDRKVDLSKVTIRFSMHGGDEPREYAADFDEVLRQQGWNDRSDESIDDDAHLTGLLLWYQPENGKDPNAGRLADALKDAGIDFGWTPHEPPYSGAILFVYRKGK